MTIELFALHHYKTITAVYIVLFILGFLVNSFVIAVFIGTRSLRQQSGNYILLSLTISDWMMATLGSSLGIYANAKYWWTLDPAYCQYFGFISSLGGYTCMIHITALAGEKLFTLKLSTTQEITKAKMLILVICLWLFSFVWALFPLIGWSYYAPEPGYAGCSIAWYSDKPADKAFIVCLFIVFFFFPISFATFCFAIIYFEVRKLARNAVQRWGTTSGPTQQTLRAKAKTIRMSLIMVLAFMFAWTPYAVVALYSSFVANDLSPTAATIPAMFAKSSTFYNPIIYFFMYTKFRNAAKKMVIRRNVVAPGSGSGSTAASQNGSFMTSFPRPAQFLERLSAINKSTNSGDDASEQKTSKTDTKEMKVLEFPTPGNV
ncbi:rhodopsin [Exaiptasia diaphana]|uniref:Opsin n=1 Tax=Exaiptasia diaphana TaxID=2652724 RepID=A0A346FTZ8_EXADI|nr:rhodopsin [Exaiptasia diaphana]AXN75741.1 opsin [Exaiptasia diaphana]